MGRTRHGPALHHPRAHLNDLGTAAVPAKGMPYPESVPGLSDLERRCVVPFYLKMMGLNATGRDVPLDELLKVARETTDDEVAMLLGSHWRPRVMGAWLASGRAQRLKPALLASLETSAGSLTAPPLAAVALHGLAETAVPSLTTYLRRDLGARMGLCPVRRRSARTTRRHAGECCLRRPRPQVRGQHAAYRAVHSRRVSAVTPCTAGRRQQYCGPPDCRAASDVGPG